MDKLSTFCLRQSGREKDIKLCRNSATSNYGSNLVKSLKVHFDLYKLLFDCPTPMEYLAVKNYDSPPGEERSHSPARKKSLGDQTFTAQYFSIDFEISLYPIQTQRKIPRILFKTHCNSIVM